MSLITDFIDTTTAIASATKKTTLVRSALEFAVKQGIEFEADDFRQISAWVEDIETMYAIACQSNLSAARSMEAWLGRKPYFLNGDRLYVGKAVVIEGEEWIVSSFSKHGEYLNLCLYASVGHPLKRRSVTHKDLKSLGAVDVPAVTTKPKVTRNRAAPLASSACTISLDGRLHSVLMAMPNRLDWMRSALVEAGKVDGLIDEAGEPIRDHGFNAPFKSQSQKLAERDLNKKQLQVTLPKGLDCALRLLPDRAEYLRMRVTEAAIAQELIDEDYLPYAGLIGNPAGEAALSPHS